MKKPGIFIICILMMAACKKDKNVQTVKYPATEKGTVTDVYFGDSIPDPYRWLEDDRSAETASWVKAQNEVTFGYLEKIPFRNELKQRLEKIWNYEKITAPFRKGKDIYFYKNNGLQNQFVLYRKKEDGKEEIFLDPNTFSKDGTTSLASLSFTKDGSLAAYSISEGGSDWQKIIVAQTHPFQIIEDTLTDIKFTQISWKGNEGFYYSTYTKPKGSELSAMTDQHILYYHKVGTPQKEDKIIFGALPQEKHRYIGGGVTEDNRYLVITAATSTSGNKLFIKDLMDARSKLIPITEDYASDSRVVENDGSLLYIFTNLNAPNWRLVKVDASDPAPKNWVDVIPETKHALTLSTGGGYFFAEYMVDAISQVKQYDYKGAFIRDVALPGVGSVGGLSGERDEKELYYSFTNYNTPGNIYRYDADKGISGLYWSPAIDFKSDDYQSEQVFYTSKDGTRIPMIITYKKGIKRNGKNPTLLYGYGGFNISITPSFSTVNAVWLEQGGIYAVPNIRGGGEYGKAWHDAGTKMQKQNVFDDFIAAAEYLIANNYTSPEYLAISGRSNGGLLVGAVMTQRPELMRVALPGVGVMDMLRYHTFTAGAGWAYDYGTAEESEAMFRYLKGYSPVHNVKKGVRYPATLVTTADHDDRVVPAHSFKFAAELQDKQAGNNPALIRIETNAGHGAGTPISKVVEQYADIFAFTFYNMGFEALLYQEKTFKDTEVPKNKKKIQ